MDKRRRPYAAIATDYAWSDTFHKLLEEHGDGGPLAFVLMILAAKRSTPQGTIEYSHDEDFWRIIGYPATPNRPDLDAILTLLGRCKQARRRRFKQRPQSVHTASKERPKSVHTARTHGLNAVTLTNFQAWQTMPRTWADTERKRAYRQRLREHDTADNGADNTADNLADIARTIEGTLGSREREERRQYVSSNSQSVGADATAAAPNGTATAAAEAPETYIHHTGWKLPPGQLATHLINTYPHLDDHAIQKLITTAQDLHRQHADPDPA